METPNKYWIYASIFAWLFGSAFLFMENKFLPIGTSMFSVLFMEMAYNRGKPT